MPNWMVAPLGTSSATCAPIRRSTSPTCGIDDDGLRRADGGMHRLDARPERAEAMVVGRGGVDEHRVEREQPGLEEPRHVGQEHRDEVGPALVDGGSGVGPDEQRPMPEVPAVAGARCGPGPSQWRWTTLTSRSSVARATSASRRTDGVAAAHCR
jgi:hypothetical protein